jgi:hypothetical protein
MPKSHASKLQPKAERVHAVVFGVVRVVKRNTDFLDGFIHRYDTFGLPESPSDNPRQIPLVGLGLYFWCMSRKEKKWVRKEGVL